MEKEDTWFAQRIIQVHRSRAKVYPEFPQTIVSSHVLSRGNSLIVTGTWGAIVIVSVKDFAGD